METRSRQIIKNVQALLDRPKTRSSWNHHLLVASKHDSKRDSLVLGQVKFDSISTVPERARITQRTKPKIYLWTKQKKQEWRKQRTDITIWDETKNSLTWLSRYSSDSDPSIHHYKSNPKKKITIDLSFSSPFLSRSQREEGWMGTMHSRTRDKTQTSLHKTSSLNIKLETTDFKSPYSYLASHKAGRGGTTKDFTWDYSPQTMDTKMTCLMTRNHLGRRWR